MDFELSHVPRAAPRVDDARTIRGCIVRPVGAGPHPVVILAHGYTSFMDWGFFPELSRRFAVAGVASVRFNFSGSGIGADRRTMTQPDVFRMNSYLHELEDLQVLHDHLHGGHWPDLDAGRASLLGHSRGGAMALIHASETGDYRSVVTWAAIDRVLNFSAERLALWERQGFLDVMHWTARRRLPLSVETLRAARDQAERLDVLAACRRLEVPTLIVVGDADPTVPAAAGSNLAAAAGAAARLLEVPGGDHTFGAIEPFWESIPDTLGLVFRATVSHVATNSDV